jgi:predicted PurR-regulated permease PerM
MLAGYVGYVGVATLLFSPYILALLAGWLNWLLLLVSILFAMLASYDDRLC